MTKIKLILCVVFVNLVLLCCSCGFFGDQEYVCEIDTVKSVQIVKLGEYVQEESRYEYTILSTIEDYSSFVDRLNNIEHSVNWGDPGTFKIDSVVIKIEYSQGDYDLLCANAQMFHRSGEDRTGFFFFDKDPINFAYSISFSSVLSITIPKSATTLK